MFVKVSSIKFYGTALILADRRMDVTMVIGLKVAKSDSCVKSRYNTVAGTYAAFACHNKRIVWPEPLRAGVVIAV
jgi:hypothetical protein